ncbi:MAG TPA: S41 family peptidase [Vicinamibacterales bacterium]|jgi:carboxyl-terminal processing protease|nr:S41 family peptidase [Vicinamibacterales bacterium]
MTSRTRLWVLAVSTPIIAFAIVGGYLGRVLGAGKDDTLRQLPVFEDVISLVLNNYVEEVDVRHAMRGALKGLADGLDPDSAYLTPDLVKAAEGGQAAGPADVGLVLTRQYYLRIISARDGSPAAKAGLRTGDFIRGINDRPTRDMSAFEGARLLSGAPGSKVKLLVFRGNAAEPHDLVLTRERVAGPDITSKMANATTGYVRVVDFTKDTPAKVKQAFETLSKTGAAKFVVDLRGTARGDIDDGLATARLFVPSGTLTVRQSKDQREVVAAASSDGALREPVALLVSQGTAGAAEVFAAALDGNERAELVGEHTLGRAARQRLVKLPDGSGLLLSNVRYLTPKNAAIHERGLAPDVEVEQPEVDFGAEPPAGDPTLDKALARFAEKKAAA